MKIDLPKKDKNGENFISYSQINAWNEEKGYNTNLLGKYEYIRRYFLGEKFPDRGGFAQFGSEVEDYICNRGSSDVFTENEKNTLNKIEPLGLFQKLFRLDFDGFYLMGYIDDALPDLTKIRDYKTASLNSSKKYYEDDYKQLDIYAMAIKQETGKFPNELEVCCIERNGNGFKGGRNVLTVGEQIWYIPRKTSIERTQELENYIFKTVCEISEYWKVFKKLNI